MSTKAPVAVVMIALNEGAHMEGVLENVLPWAQEVFLVDSYSTDATVDIALKHGVHVVQRKFTNFGDQWNFALGEMPITAPWTMKLDPDERLTDELKQSIERAIRADDSDAISFELRLWFMGKPLPIRQTKLRVWRTGTCRFSNVLVNEHPLVQGRVVHVDGDMEHHDSPTLDHWYDKQNRYTTAEAIAAYRGDSLSVTPALLGSPLQRRMWLKRNFVKVPFRFTALFLFHYIGQGGWRAGHVGYIWSHLRAEVHRTIEYKLLEMRTLRRELPSMPQRSGEPDPRVKPSHPRIVKKTGTRPSNAFTSNVPERRQPGLTRAVWFHQGLADSWNDRYQSGTFKKRLEFIRRSLAIVVAPGEYWLDAGCGAGLLTVELARLGAHGLAVDASSKMIDVAVRQVGHMADGFTFKRIDSISSVDVADGSFDGILCSSVVEYVERIDEVWCELNRVLKIGGKLVLSVPNSHSVIRTTQTLIRHAGRAIGCDLFPYLDISINAYSRAGLIRCLYQYGFLPLTQEGFQPLLPKLVGGFLPYALHFVVAEKISTKSLSKP